MIEEGERQTAVAQFTYRLGAALFDLIANCFGNTIRINTEAHAIEEELTHGGVEKHRFGIVEDGLQVGV